MIVNREKTVDLITQNPVGIIERGFSSQDIIRELCKKHKFFVRRLKNNQIFKILEDSQGYLVAEESVLEVRVIAFCDVDNKTEYRLATNLATSGDRAITMNKLERDIEKHGQKNCCGIF